MVKRVKYIIRIIILIVVIVTLKLAFFNDKDETARGSITIWANSMNFDYLNEAANNFMELNDKCKINVIKVYDNEYENKVEDVSLFDNPPNIVQLNSNYIARNEKLKNTLIEENTLVNDYSKNFSEGRIDEIRDGDKILGVPLTTRPLLLYLREDMLSQYGYSYEDINTWGDLINMGKDVYVKSNGRVKILNGTGEDYSDLISLLVMQSMEESKDKNTIKSLVENRINQLINENILNTNPKGEFLARISSINGMRELKALDVKCIWTANNVPSKSSGSNRLYVAEGDNLVVLKKDENNNTLIRKFLTFLISNTDNTVKYVKEGQMFSSYLSSYKDKAIEEEVKNFKGKSPLVIMSNIIKKAPIIKNYDLYRDVKSELLTK